MGGAPSIVWLRPGVGYVEAAAASMARLESAFHRRYGRQRTSNSTYRDYGKQLKMWRDWTAWEQGRGPKPNHSRALHPDESMHCRGLADDTNEWTTPGYIALAADHGWIRTAAWDPTERHHFEYQERRDNHRHEGWPAGTGSTPFPRPDEEEEEEEMTPEQMKEVKEHITHEVNRAITNILRDTPSRMLLAEIPSALPGEPKVTLGKQIRAGHQRAFNAAQRAAIAAGYEPGLRAERYVRSSGTGDVFALYPGGLMFRVTDPEQAAALADAPRIDQRELWKRTEIPTDWVEAHPGDLVGHERSVQSGTVYAVYVNSLGLSASRRLTGAPEGAEVVDVDQRVIWAYTPINYTL